MYIFVNATPLYGHYDIYIYLSIYLSAAALPAGFKKRQLTPKPMVVPKKKGMLVVLAHVA